LNKRAFLKSLGLGLAGVTGGLPLLAEEKKDAPSHSIERRRPPKNWIWISNEQQHTRDEWKRILGEAGTRTGTARACP
jgi:hypothetical protein